MPFNREGGGHDHAAFARSYGGGAAAWRLLVQKGAAQSRKLRTRGRAGDAGDGGSAGERAFTHYICIILLMDVGNRYAGVVSFSGQSQANWLTSCALLVVFNVVAVARRADRLPGRGSSPRASM